MTEQSLPQPIAVLEVPVHPLSRDELINAINDWSGRGVLKRVYNVNTHAMNLAARYPDFQEALRNSDLVYCDGFGVQLAARILGASIPERLSVMDWLDGALESLAHKESSIFLLGDEASVVEHTAQLMQSSHPKLRVIGHQHGFFAKTGRENDAVARRLRSLNPDVVFVAMGMPTQELWIEHNLRHLPPSVYIPVGAAFKWYSGAQQRPPVWMRNHGLEWFGRLVVEPRRLASRYLIGNARFLISVTSVRLRRRRP